MSSHHDSILRNRLDRDNYRKLVALNNPKLQGFVAHFVEHCNPDSVFVVTDDPSDIAYVRRQAIARAEEKELAMDGHTVHFDGYHDQARDKENTRYLVPPEIELGENVSTVAKDAGLREVRSYLSNSMAGREMVVRFFCLGPCGSDFAIHCVQLTDSFYVAHTQDLLYRQGYETFRRIGDSKDFFRFIHSVGRLRNGVSADVGKRRVYVDIEENVVYSVNTQYGGNSVGLKKLAMRLAIRKAAAEGWLTEHMLIMGVHGPGGRATYFAGAFPSACGKTATAMVPGETIVGDDIAYLRKRQGRLRAVNVEKGIFGIIRDVNSRHDPIIWEALTSPGEVIFSNVLVTPDGVPYWIGKDGPCPERGVNHSGEWYPGKLDEKGNEITPSHRNARFTLSLAGLRNCDPRLDDPEGVPIGGIIYGGRDKDTCVPVEQAFDWPHGIITKGASLESETTAATLGKEGVRKFNLMSILDFLAIPLGRYIQNNLDFAEGLTDVPLIFGVNYFLKDEKGQYLNATADKRVWLKWMELRVQGDADALETPTGFIPRYDDLCRLFGSVLDKAYSRDDYVRQFSTRVLRHLDKIKRIENIYRNQVRDTPLLLFEVLQAQRQRLEAARVTHGDLISPCSYE